MPIKPEEIDPSNLQVSLRGYDRAATDELLKRVAWDYRQAVRAQEEWAKDRKQLNERIEELEARLASQQEEYTRAIAARDARSSEEASERTAPLEAELSRLQRKLREHEARDELTRAVLQTAQRSAREIRDSARRDAEALLKVAHRRAAEIERDAHTTVRRSATEIDRLKRLEGDLRDRLRLTLEAVIGHNGTDGALAAGEDPQSEQLSANPAE